MYRLSGGKDHTNVGNEWNIHCNLLITVGLAKYVLARLVVVLSIERLVEKFDRDANYERCC